MPSFVNTFGGTNIYPSDVSYRAITLTANTTLAWPTEVATDSNVAAEIMDVTATSGSLTIRMPPADEASVGQTALFFNPGSNAFTVADNGGNVITVVAAGESWQVYITGNATANGTWRTVEYGAGTSSVAAGSLAGKGIKAITTTLNQSMPVLTYPIIPGTYSYTLDEAQRASTIIWDSSTTGTLTLAGATVNGSDWFCHVRNNGAGSTIIACSPGDQINGLSSLTFGPGDSATLFCDGNNYFTIGQGNVSTSGILAFDYVSLDLTGVTSPYVLQGVELNRVSYNFTGTLTANMEIVVPLNLQQYWVRNSTSGPHALTVKTLSGTGVQVQQGYAQILYCNGVNVVAANDPPGVTDIPVSAGGIYVDNFSGNGLTQVFSLTYDVVNEDRTQVYINGVYQQKNTYTVTGTTLSFSVAPPASSTIEVVSLGSVNIIPSGDVTLTPSGYTTAITVQSGFDDLGSSAGTSKVGFIQAGTGAVSRTAQSKLRDTVSVKDFGAVGDGVANDTAAIIAACAAANSIDFPAGTYKITSTIEPGANKYLNFSNASILSSVAGPAFLIRGNTDGVTFAGDVSIDCQNTAGSVGLKIQATTAIASPATTNTFDRLFIQQADIGVHLYSDGNQGIYYNDFYRVQVQDSTKGIFLETAGGGASQREVNANHFGMVTLQRCVDALTLNGTWGNYFDFVEAETNTGIAINLVNAFSVGINGGWIEGNTTNLSIGNVPNVYGVYIKASIDSALDSADTKFVYTPSEDRSIIIENSQYAKWFGRAGFEERVDIGDYGVAANDQGNSPDGYGRLRVTASQDFFRLSSGSPLFFMRARTGTEGWYFGLDNGATRLLDLQRSRAVLDTRLALANSAWDKNQLTLGAYYLWVDASGRLRIKSGAPVSDTDGTVVGTQT